MSKKNLPTDLLEQATNVQNAWTRIDEKLIIGGLTVATLANSIQDLHQHVSHVQTIRNCQIQPYF